jgi:outer membrane lipoprotein-sorting protein
MFKKTFVMGLLMLVAGSYAVAIGEEDVSKGQMDAAAIMSEVGKIMSLADVRSEQVLTVAREDATIRQYRLKIMTSGREKAFAEIVEPKQFKGRQFLRRGDNVWAYFPNQPLENPADRRVKKAIRISGRQTFMGGDFTNYDVLRVNLVDDYLPEVVDDLPDQYVLELKGKDVTRTYATIRMWVRKNDFQPIRQEFYSISGEPIKSVLYHDYRDFGGGLTRPGMLEMQSALFPKSKTFLEIIYLKRGVTNPAKRFNVASLGK